MGASGSNTETLPSGVSYEQYKKPTKLAQIYLQDSSAETEEERRLGIGIERLVPVSCTFDNTHVY
jgi:hypothetical protein